MNWFKENDHRTAQEVKRCGRKPWRWQWTWPCFGEALGTPGPLPAQPRGTVPFPGVSELVHPLAFALPLSRSHVSPPRFFCKIASHLFFTFTFLIHLEFVWLYLSGVQFHFLPDGGSLVPAPFISQSTLFPPNWNTTFVVYYVLMYTGIYFWILCSFPLSVPLPMPHWFDYSGFIVCSYFR